MSCTLRMADGTSVRMAQDADAVAEAVTEGMRCRRLMGVPQPQGGILGINPFMVVTVSQDAPEGVLEPSEGVEAE